MTSKYLEDALERAKQSKAPGRIIQFPLVDKGRESLCELATTKERFEESLILERQLRLDRTFTAALAAVGSDAALREYHRHLVEFQNMIYAEIVRRAKP